MPESCTGGILEETWTAPAKTAVICVWRGAWKEGCGEWWCLVAFGGRRRGGVCYDHAVARMATLHPRPPGLHLALKHTCCTTSTTSEADGCVLRAGGGTAAVECGNAGTRRDKS